MKSLMSCLSYLYCDRILGIDVLVAARKFSELKNFANYAKIRSSLKFILTCKPYLYSNTCDCRDVNKIQMGIGDKMGICFQWTSSFLTGVVIGFVYGWKLTLVILAFSPLIMVAALIQDKVKYM